MGLRELALHSVVISPNGCRTLGNSGILSRLELLDLTGGDLDDASAAALAECPDFARIPRVILDKNFIEPGMVRRLRQINRGVQAKNQDDDW